MENIPEHAVEFRQTYGQIEVSVYGADDMENPKVVALLSTKPDSIYIDTVEATEDAKGKGYGKALYLAVARHAQENYKESITGSASEDALWIRKGLFPTATKQQDDLVFVTSDVLPEVNYTPKSFRSSEDDDYNLIPLNKRFQR
jgi:predicted GNAT family acetyltransferase